MLYYIYYIIYNMHVRVCDVMRCHEMSWDVMSLWVPFLDSLSSIRSIKRSRKASTGTHLEVILGPNPGPMCTYTDLRLLDGSWQSPWATCLSLWLGVRTKRGLRFTWRSVHRIKLGCRETWIFTIYKAQGDCPWDLLRYLKTFWGFLTEARIASFPTCQVRVVRFYHSCSPPPPRPTLRQALRQRPSSVCAAGPQPGTFPAQWAPLDLNLGPSQLSGHRWTSTWDFQVHCWTSTWDFQCTAGPQPETCPAQCAPLDLNGHIECQKICQIECQKICQIEC